MENLYNKTPIGVSYPISIGTSGYFKQDYDSISVAKSSIRLLLGTIKGERRMNPTYGSGLWTYLFNNIDDISDEIISDIVIKDISEWIPDIFIKSINTIKKNTSSNTYRVELIITFISASSKDRLETLQFSTDILKN